MFVFHILQSSILSLEVCLSTFKKVGTPCGKCETATELIFDTGFSTFDLGPTVFTPVCYP